MKNGGLFGISVEDLDGTVLENIVQLDYHSDMQDCMSRIIDHVTQCLEDMPSEILDSLNHQGVQNIYEWVLYDNAIESFLAEDLGHAAAFAHLIMKHHGTMYGLLTRRRNMSTTFMDLESSLPKMVLGLMSVMLPSVQITTETFSYSPA
ncbi:hypothetical protein MKK68_04490 [Methylobacterium sp. E-016]|nr:hypothetical protein [Methylobacterium sp. E-016]